LDEYTLLAVASKQFGRVRIFAILDSRQKKLVKIHRIPANNKGSRGVQLQ